MERPCRSARNPYLQSQMNVSLPAIKMLGDLLTDQEQRINDANSATDEQLERDLEAVNELWKLYQSLMP